MSGEHGAIRLETGSFRGTTGEELFSRTWHAPGESAAVMVLAHGLGEHSGRYDHVGRYLAERGVSVFSYDHLGHGRSGGKLGWLGSFSHFLDDLASFHERTAEANAGRPLFLLGHSMGGLIVTAYLLERPRKPDFLILSGAAIVPLLAGDGTIDPTRLSKDPAVWEAYMNDPLILRERVTDELLGRLADGLGLLPGRASEIDVPCLVIHGEADRLCSAEGAKTYIEWSSSPDATYKIYRDGRHEMFNETNKAEVLADLWQWIEQRLGC